MGARVRLLAGLGLAMACFGATAAAQTVVDHLDLRPPGVENSVGFDFEVAVVEMSGLVYVGSTGAYGAEVGVIDPATGTIVTVTALPGGGFVNFARVNQSRGLVYFRQPPSNIVVIDGRPFRSTFNQALPTISFAGTPEFVIESFAIDEVRGRLYVTRHTPFGASPFQSLLTVIDASPSSGSFHPVIDEVALPQGALVRGVAVNTVTNRVYLAVAGAQEAGVWLFDTASRNLVRLDDTDGGKFGIVVDETRNLVFATGLNSLDVVDGGGGQANSFLARIDLSPFGETRPPAYDERLALNRRTGRVYVRTHDFPLPSGSGKVIVVDGDRASPTFATVTAAIDVGRESGRVDIVVDEVLDRVITTSGSDRGTYIIDGVANTVTAVIPSLQLPSDVALDPIEHRAYVANQLNFIQTIDLAAETLTSTIVTGVELVDGVVDPGSHQLYFPLTTGVSEVLSLDPDGSLERVSGLPTLAGRYLFTAANRKLGRIYVLNTLSGLNGDVATIPGMVVIDGAARSVVASVPLGSQPFGMAVDETTGTIYVANAGVGVVPASLTVVDGATHATVTADTSAFASTARFLLPVRVNEATNKVYFGVIGVPTFTAGVLDGGTNVARPLTASADPVDDLAVSKTFDRIYLASRDAGIVHVIDGTTEQEVAALPTGSPAALALDETAGKLYVADRDQGVVTVIDTASDSIAAAITVGAEPQNLAVDERTGRVYVFNSGDGTLSVIDGPNATVTATLTLPGGPVESGAAIALDPDLGRVYVLRGEGHALVTVVSDAPAAAPQPRRGGGGGCAAGPPGAGDPALALLLAAAAAGLAGRGLARAWPRGRRVT